MYQGAEQLKAFERDVVGVSSDIFLGLGAGIAVSNDPVLQTRVLAYADTQRYRLGVNYQLLPANMPKCPFHNNHMDGAMNYTIRDEEVLCSTILIALLESSGT